MYCYIEFISHETQVKICIYVGLQGEAVSFMEVTATCQTVANVSELEITKIFVL